MTGSHHRLKKTLNRKLTPIGAKAKVTKAFEVKLTSTATLSPRPLCRKGKISEIINQPMGPNDIYIESSCQKVNNIKQMFERFYSFTCLKI